MESRFRSPTACLAAAAIAALLAVGCGSGNDSDTSAQTASPARTSGAPEAPATEQPLTEAQLHGRDLFVQHCGSCHTLDAAGTIGQIGPDLDEIPLSEADVLRAIRTGGGRHSRGEGGRTGNMPRNLVTGQDARDVAAFVSASGS